MRNQKKLAIIVVMTILFLSPVSQALAQGETQVGVFKDYTIAPDSMIEIPIEIKNVKDLYAIDVEMQFDPAVVNADDADSATTGVQPALGMFLDPGLILFNFVDNEKGIVRFVMTQINPSEPKSGDGIILVVYFRAIKVGETDLRITSLTLSDRAGVEIIASPVDASIKVETGAPIVSNTSIPVQNPTSMIIIPTMAPSPTPTITPKVTATPMPTATPKSAVGGQDLTDPTQMAVENEASGTEENEKSAFQQYWWILLIVVLLVAAVAVYLVIGKRKQDQGEGNNIEF